MDPGNWATGPGRRARVSEPPAGTLVLVVSNPVMAILLQIAKAARLGIVAGRDLAQACRESYSQRRGLQFPVGFMKSPSSPGDLAEVLGAPSPGDCSSGLPLLVGVVLTALDTFLVLWLSRYGIRLIEAVILSLIAIVTGCFLVELFWAKPAWHEMASGILPRLNSDSLYVAIGILGATVMPHNLYLHSALVQTRRLGKTIAERREACRFNLFDSVIALNGALIVNGAILVLAAAVFFKHGILVTQIEQAQLLLTPLLGTALAGSLFAVALLASGQSSTLTGTYAGQIVMEGFLSLRLRPWLRRLVTRALAIIPAVLTIYYFGDTGTYKLLILSQVILSMQLPFAVIPLIRFTNDSRRMGGFANRAWVRMLAWGAAALIIGLNLWLVVTTIGPWMTDTWWHSLVAGPPILAILWLLGYVTLVRTAPPMVKVERSGALVATDLPVPHYRKILVPLDHSKRDRAAIAHAVSMARSHGASLYLLHVEEGVTSQLFGALSNTEEILSGEEYFGGIVQSLTASGLAVELSVEHGITPTDSIVRKAREIQPDLIVMGAHGHRGVKDLIFGNTINAVRHQVAAPVLVVGGEPSQNRLEKGCRRPPRFRLWCSRQPFFRGKIEAAFWSHNGARRNAPPTWTSVSPSRPRHS